MASEGFRAKDIALKTQKKFISRMNKTTVKMFIDDKSGNILDNTYRLFKQYTGNKKEAEKLIKCIIKTVIKIGVLYRNNQFDNNEMQITSKLQRSFCQVVMTITSFYELEFSYDYHYLSQLLNNLHSDVHLLVQNHLTDKSLNRISHLFQFIVRKEFCDAMFLNDSPYRDTIDKIVQDLHTVTKNNN